MARRVQYVYPRSKRWPIGDQEHARLAATYLLAGRGKPSDWPTVFEALQKHWGKDPEVRKLLRQYLRQGPPPSKRARPNPSAKKGPRGPVHAPRARGPGRKDLPNPADVCDISYEAFRAYGPDFTETYWELRQEHDERIRKHNDYSQPPKLARILGRMHETKMQVWEEHQRLCEAEGNPKVPKPNPCGKPKSKPKAKAKPKANPARSVRVDGRLRRYTGPWERLSSTVALTRPGKLWTLTHSPSGMGLKRFKSKAKAKAFAKKADKRAKLGRWKMWKMASNPERASVAKWLGG